jgi:hypothetical protein
MRACAEIIREGGILEYLLKKSGCMTAQQERTE